ncbi:MAG: hypothetical protein AABX66_00090 [Nanoarchaeota archaeon]
MLQIKNECALPVRCSRCGNVFDLGYDISIDEAMFEEFVQAMRMRSMQVGLLCWNCR